MTKHNMIVGSVSSGTMRYEDLIPSFLEELGWRDSENQLHRDLSAKLDSMTEEQEEEYYNSEDAQQDLESLFDELGGLEDNLPYFYFGAHPGDGADYGYWLSEVFEYDFDGLKVNDTSEVPEDYGGEVLVVNDHGNMTLYTCSNGELTEIWAVV